MILKLESKLDDELHDEEEISEKLPRCLWI